MFFKIKFLTLIGTHTEKSKVKMLFCMTLGYILYASFYPEGMKIKILAKN